MENRRTLTAGMVTLVTLIAFEAVAVTSAMPSVARALGGLALYGFAFGGALATSVVGTVLGGSWCDRAGPARPTAVGVALFCLGLLVAGLAPQMWVLVLGRLVQGFGGGLVNVALFVIIGRAYPASQHARVISFISAAWVLPAILGPAVAGLIVDTLGWRWVFLLVVVAAVPAFAVIWRPVAAISVLAGTPASARAWWAAGAAVGALVLYVGGHWALLVAGFAIVAVCGVRLLPRGTLTLARGLPAVVLLRGLAGAAFMQADVFIPLLLTRERGFSPALAGLSVTVGALFWSAGSWVQARQGQRLSDPARLRIGAASIAVGVLSAMAVTAAAVPVSVVIAGWCFAGLGMGLVSPGATTLVLRLSHPAEQGANSSALSVSDALLTTVALAAGGSLFAALVDRGPVAYLVAFAVALVPAAAGVLVAGRTFGGSAGPEAPLALAGERAGAGRG
ncbi:MFS transporter [Dactylosporangium vinaceum]|uniref:MFS transporter n=1 Tax=Dactylosporangium vinaceum TaxID=53362 RepID=A0ABV5M6G1_9ACTN|nr:MFS transporter [Dactylosporangium vinaceum]